MEKLKNKKNKVKDNLKHKVKGRLQPIKVWKMSDEQLDAKFSKKFFDEVEDQFQTGDVILSRGTEAFSMLIRKGTMSTWSHAAMIVRDPSPLVRKTYKIDQSEEDLKEKVFIFESDTETQDKRQGGGTQLFPFRRWMKCCVAEYGDTYLVVWRKLNRPEQLALARDLEVFPTIDDWLIKMYGIGYEHSRAQLVKSAIHKNKDEDLTTIFCSELVAATLKHFGLLHPESNSNNFVPRDFTSDQRLDGKDLVLHREGFQYSKEMRIKFRVTANEGTVIESVNVQTLN